LRNGEIDFVVKNKNGLIEYYQIAWDADNEETREREFGRLESIRDNYPKYLLTTESFLQSRNGIEHKNVFEWLLSSQRR